MTYDDMFFDLLFRIAPSGTSIHRAEVSLASMPGVFGEMAERMASERESWGRATASGDVLCHMAVMGRYTPDGFLNTATQDDPVTDELLARIVEIGRNLGYSFDYDAPLVHMNAERYAVQFSDR